MFHLNISASLILQPPTASDSDAAADKTMSSASSADFINVSVAPSMFRQWSADIFGDDKLESCAVPGGDPDGSFRTGTYDIRVDWGSGAFSEVRGVPLAIEDTLVIDPCGEVLVSTQCDNALAPAVVPFLR